MATMACIKLPKFPANFKLTYPGMGEMQFLKDSMENLPRPSSMLLKILNSAGPVLGPFYAVLRIIDVVQAIAKCTQAVKDCIIELSPSPLLKCFPKLIKALAKLIPLIPPLAYVQMILDIIKILAYLVDDIADLLSVMDKEISTIKAVIKKAQDSGDANLLEIGECAKQNLSQQGAALLQVFEVLGKFMDIINSILDVLAAAAPSLTPLVEKIKKEIAKINEEIESADTSGYPPISSFVDIIKILQMVLGYVDKVLSAIVGLNFDPEAYAPPDFSSLVNS